MANVEKVYIFRIAARSEIKVINVTKVPFSSSVTGGSASYTWVAYVHNNRYVVQKDDIGDYIEMGGEKWYLNDDKRQEEVQDEPLFVFHINPKALKLEMTKIIKKIFTRGGIEYQHWGDDAHVITFQGTTGSILPTGADVALGREIYDTPAYKKLLELRDVYTYDQDELGSQHGSRLLGLHYRRRLYIGHFEKFSFEENEDNPFQINFDALYTAHFEATDPAAAVVHVSSSITARQKAISTLRDVLGESAVEIL